MWIDNTRPWPSSPYQPHGPAPYIQPCVGFVPTHDPCCPWSPGRVTQCDVKGPCTCPTTPTPPEQRPSIHPVVGGWTKLGACEKCGMPIWARPSDDKDQMPDTRKSCGCCF